MMTDEAGQTMSRRQGISPAMTAVRPQPLTSTSATEGDQSFTTNTVEGFYSIFKRGMKGVYISIAAKKHLHR